ncbi:hypothetical protein EBQ93_04005 [bacterium]|nr:hypothetical protein [bacterium]
MFKKILFWGCAFSQIWILNAQSIKRVVNNTHSVYAFTLVDNTNKVYSVVLKPGAIASVSFAGKYVKKIEFTPKAPIHKPFTDLYKRAIKDRETLNENMIYIINHGQNVTVYPPATDEDYALLAEYDNEYGTSESQYENPEVKSIIDSHLGRLKGYIF